MIRHLQFVCVLAVASLLARAQAPQQQVAPPAQSSQPPAVVGSGPQPVQPVTPVAPNAPVVTIHGICPEGQPVVGEKSDPCTLVLTRSQFETLISSINVTNQTYTTPALRSLAAGYVTVLTLADAGEKAGVDKDPRFQEMMKVARARALADGYRRYLQEKYGNPSAEEIAAYYRQNTSKFEQMKIDRILIPRVNPKPQDRRPDFEKKARDLAAQIRERAASGEDMTALQVEAYKTLGLDSQPPQTEVTATRKGAFLPAVEQDINALKPGQVTKVEFEPSGFNIYKLRSRAAIPIELAKPQIVRELSQQNIDAALKAATVRVHSDLNEQFFDPHPGGGPRPARVPNRVAPLATPTAQPVQSPPSPSQKPAPPQ